MKSKKYSEFSTHKKHNKTTSNFTRNVIDKYPINSMMIQAGTNTNKERKTNIQKNLKNIINNIVTN